jgi:hypothetical protein
MCTMCMHHALHSVVWELILVLIQASESAILFEVLFRYEEQSVKLASLESMHRKQQRELLRSGGAVDCVSLKSVTPLPQSHTPKLGDRCDASWEAENHNSVNRELFGRAAVGEENDVALALTPVSGCIAD